jgi:hypothetical protein
LAKEAGIPHPSEHSIQLYMSSDFLVDSSSSECPRFVLQAKYVNALDDPRTAEKLELERRYWEEKEVPWQTITESEVPKTVLTNIKWLYPATMDEIDDDLLINRMDVYTEHFANNANLSIIEICKKLDVAYDLELGESLLEVRQLLAKRFFQFDIFVPTIKLKGRDIRSVGIDLVGEALRVSNQ